MKKLIFVGALIGTVGSIYAQKVGEVQSSKEHSDVAKILTFPISGSSGAETIIWSEDFSNGIPSTWLNYGTANGTSDPDAKWEYRGPNTTPSNSVGSRGAYMSAQTPIASATASNGFVIFDSDYLDNGGIAGNFGNGIAAAPHTAELITNTINLTGSSNIVLNFTQYYRRFAGPGGSQAVPATYVDFSINGGATWSNTVALNSTVGVNSSTPTNSSISIPIGSYVGGQGNVKIRFRFNGDYYFWIIDDISITGQQANSIASYPNFLGEAYDVEFIGGVKQGHLSTSQAQPINFKGSLWNNGTAAQTGVKLSVSIFKDGNYQTDIIGIQQNLASGDSAILTTQSWTPPAPGNYQWIYRISADSIQPLVISDTISFDFENVQSMDFGNWDNSIGASTNSSQWGDGSAVCQLMRILANDTLLGVEIGISSLTQPGSIIELAVYDSAAYLGNNGSWNSSLIRAYKQVVVSSTDTLNGFVYVDLTNPISGSGVPLSSTTRAYFLNVTMYNNQGANYITLKNDQTYLKSPGTGYMYMSALGSWYSGYSGSKSFNNVWLRANLSGGQSAPPIVTGCDEFFISEYVEGSSNNKALEIYNPTSATKSIAGYKLALYSNGATSTSNTFVFPSGTTIPAFGTYVIAHAQGNSSLLAVADTSYNYPNVVSFNGDDAVVFFDPNNDTIDIIGVVGVDPGINWIVGSGATSEHTLVRRTYVSTGQLDWTLGAFEWDVYSQNDFSFLGSHLSNCYTPPPPFDQISDYRSVDSLGVLDSLNSQVHFVGKVFTPDFDGNSGYSFYIHDGTGGINVYRQSDLMNYTNPLLGDSIEVFGNIIQYQGLAEILPDSITLFASYTPIQAPIVISMPNEELEAELIKLESVYLTNPSQWSNSGSGFNVDVTNGTDTFVIRIDNDCELYSATAPSGLLNITGVCGQYDPTSPFTSGYQIWPRDSADIEEVLVNITFQVDLHTQPLDSIKGVHLAGTFNNWQPDSIQMLDVSGDGIFSATVPLIAGDTTVQYKFINGNSWSDPHDQVIGACSVNSTGDRWLHVPYWNDTLPPVHLSSCSLDQPIDVLPDVQPLICTGDTIVLDAGTGVWNVIWNTGDTAQSISVTAPGTYWFTANWYQGNPGITVFDTTRVENHPVSQVFAGNDMTLCPGDSIQLNARYSQDVVLSIDSTVSISSPNSIAGNYPSTIPTLSSTGWGTLISQNLTDTLVLMNDGSIGLNNDYGYAFPESLCGCDSLGVVSNQNLAGKIVLISRGSCEFGRKAYLAQLAGATGVVIYNSYPDSSISGGLINMAPGAYGNMVNISSAFVSNSTGSLFSSFVSSGTGASYIWSNGVQNLKFFTPAVTTTLTIQGIDVFGCSSFDTITFIVHPKPDTSVTFSGSLSFCSGSSVTLTAASGQSYLWSTGDTTQSITSSQSGTYYAVVTTVNGCTDTTAMYTTTLFADPDTTVTATQTLFCASDSATISAASGYDYLWNTGDTTQSITVNTAGGYYVTLTSTDGCLATTDTTMITVVPDIVLPQITSNGLGWVITGSSTNFTVPLDSSYSYQWGVTGGAIQFGQGSNGIAVLWGAPDSNVAVWVVISNGVCSDSVGISINISGIGVNEGAMQNVRLFPNPNDGYFTVEVGEAYVGASYEVVDGMGRAVERGVITSTLESFDLADKPKGVYRINIRTNTDAETMVVIVQ